MLIVAPGCGDGPGDPAEESIAEDARVFEVNGRIRGIASDRETLNIEHEEIPGFMAAMTMPFHLADPTLAEGLEAGDAVRFRYVVRARESYIDRIEKLADDAVPSSPAGGGARRPADPRVPRLEVGDLVPDFRLINQDNEPFYLHEFEDKALVLTFIFTRCPVPDFCPLMSGNFQAIQDRVAEDTDLQEKTHLISVTIDPEFDTPEVLAEYATRYTDDTESWTFATGGRDRIDEMTTRFSVYIEDDPESDNIDHALATVLIGPDRQLKNIWRGNAWSPDEVVADLKAALNP
jgi:protein SCO1